LDKYRALLDALSKTSKRDNYVKLSAFLLRPLQDVEKLSRYLKHNKISVDLENPMYNSNDEYEYMHAKRILDNPTSSRAEVNLAKEFSRTPELYIDVSKLCCGTCDHVLNLFRHKHRGTHGTCDGWKAPLIQFSTTFNDLKAKSNNNKDNLNDQLSQQHRQLSDNDLPSLFQTNNSCFEFQRYKENLLGAVACIDPPYYGIAKKAELYILPALQYKYNSLEPFCLSCLQVLTVC